MPSAVEDIKQRGQQGRRGSDQQRNDSSAPTTSVPMNGSPSSSSGGVSPPELAAMLRKSADVVERKEFHPLLYQTMRALTAYAGEYADGSIRAATATPSPSVPSAAASSAAKEAQQHQRERDQKSRRRDAPGSDATKKDRDRGDPSSKTPAKPSMSAFVDVPDVLDPDRTVKKKGAGPSSAAGAPPAKEADPLGMAAARGVQGGSFSTDGTKQESGQKQNPMPSRGKPGVFNQEGQQFSRGKGVFSLKGIKKGIEKIGADILGDHDRDRGGHDVPSDEMAYTRKNAANNSSNDMHHSVATTASADSVVSQHQQQTSAHALRQSQTPNANATSSPGGDPEKPAKPCFQRPINPSSNLIANGWIDQQRRSKMRVVWKDVLASLVEGRRPGEETTLWIQRQVINQATGKVTGLEALHQIPMKWLEDVNYVDIYGDHRFTLKVYNIAEEFYFRTRDEQSAQSWVLTLRSARDASLEGNIRMLGPSSSSAHSAATEKTMPLAKDMGLHDLDDWDVKKQNSNEGATSSPPMAQAGGDGGRGGRASPLHQQQQQQQAQPAAPVRKKISELRAIAHGAGYNTRGMERQDLERIAAYVQSGSYNPNPPTSAPPAASSAGSDKVKQDTQQDATTREAEQRAAAEKHEKEQQAMTQKQAQEDAALRRQKENEERAVVEKMRREREAAEQMRVEEQMAAQAEQQRRRQEFEQQQQEAAMRAAEQQRMRQELEQQAAEIKRQQEEERQRKMAELQAAEQARQQQQQAQAAATAEHKKREEEEQRRRQQQQQQQQQAQQEEQRRRQQQQQQQAQRPGTMPSPPTSGNYPQGNFQPQQQQQHQQWGQQQQQHYQKWQQHQQQQQQHAHFQQQGYTGQQQPAHPQQHPHHQHFFNQNMPQQGAYQQQQHHQQHAHFQHQQHHQQHQQQQHPQHPGVANTPGANLPPNSKYAKQMEEKNNDDEDQSGATLQIKRSILINWALQPPNLNVLRPIDELVTTIHTAMPPAFGVASHAYFAKFTPIGRGDLIVSAAMGNNPDETKLKKAVRKVRVFLHPDKLPRDLTPDQHFAARMLWDITSDSWEEFQKHKDELDWIRN